MVNFQSKMQCIDDELARKEIPIHDRAFHAFHLLAPDYHGVLLGTGIDSSLFGDFEGPNLLEKINDWYKEIYSERFNMPSDRGKVPVLIKREIYLIRIPLCFGSPNIEILPLVNGLTQSMARNLSNDELNEIQKKFGEGYSLIYEFEDLWSQINCETSNGKERKDNPFLNSAMRDLGTASDCLESSVDTNGAIFHSQQLAEKMLKAVLFHAKNLTEEEIRKKYNHKIIDVYNDVCSYTETAFQIEDEVNTISKYKMNIRYTSTVIGKNEAVSAYWSGLNIGGFCATILSGQKRRYQP